VLVKEDGGKGAGRIQCPSKRCQNRRGESGVSLASWRVTALSMLQLSEASKTKRARNGEEAKKPGVKRASVKKKAANNSKDIRTEIDSW
jgi:hypothetical protein